MNQTLEASFPEKTGFLFEPHRYKVLFGGRGSGKSYAIARYLLIAGISEKIRVLCTREVQKSIRDSVKRLLEDQIEALGISKHYKSYETEIRGINGTLFLFNGLSTETVDSLKSYENLAKVWCEEAHSISKRSWDILIPTVRAEGSEILISFNPSLESDETYQRFIVNPPEDCISVWMNYHDNPWFPQILEQERIHCKRIDPNNYDNIWEGKCLPAVEGAIYFKEVQQTELDGRITRVPYDPLLKVHIVFDLGFNDLMAIGLIQKSHSDIRIIKYIQGTGRTLADYSSELRSYGYNWGRCWLPHDGYSRDYKTGQSSAEIMRRLGWDVPDRSEIAELSIEEGIRLVRISFPQMVFDKDSTGELIECLKRYRRQINRQTNVAGAPLHDSFCLPAGELIRTNKGDVPIEKIIVGDKVSLPGGIFGTVIKSGESGTTIELCEIKTKDGKVLKTTPNHKILTDKGIVLARDLSYNHLILTSGGVLWKILKLYSTVGRIGYRDVIINVTTNGRLLQDICTEISGLKLMVGRYLKDTVSIILMGIDSIMRFPIWFLCQNQNICHTMPLPENGQKAIEILTRYCETQDKKPPLPLEHKNAGKQTLRDGRQTINCTNGLGLMGQWKRLKKPESLPVNGIKAKPVVNGIAKTAKIYGKTKHLLKLCVLFAVKNIAHFSPLVQSSAIKIVKLKRYDVERQKVYNITVDHHHCYVANGLMVSNSNGADMLRYVCCNKDQMHNDYSDAFWQYQDRSERAYDGVSMITGY